MRTSSSFERTSALIDADPLALLLGFEDAPLADVLPEVPVVSVSVPLMPVVPAVSLPMRAVRSRSIAASSVPQSDAPEREADARPRWLLDADAEEEDADEPFAR